MKRTVILLCSSLLLLASSCTHEGYTIHGKVVSPEGKDLNGKYIFLVPVPVIESEIDSVKIKNNKFKFSGTTERIADLRIEMKHRIGTQNLLVVTEPGDIYVTIGPKSSGGGTRQNDSLQVWKDITEKLNADRAAGYKKATTKDEHIQQVKMHNKRRIQALNEVYFRRTQQLAHNVGDSTTLGSFLLKMYPEKTEVRKPGIVTINPDQLPSPQKGQPHSPQPNKLPTPQKEAK